MAKRRQKKSARKQTKRRKSQSNKNRIPVKSKFRKAVSNLKRLSARKQREAIGSSSNEFIRDMSSFLTRIRKKPQLVNAKQRKVLQRHRTKLRKIINKRTPMSEKRRLLTQKGGIAPLLIPIITAIIGAAGGIGASAAGAAIMKS